MALDKIQLLALIDNLFRTGVPDNVTAAGLRQAFKETVEFAEAGSFENIDFEYDPEATYNTTDKKYAEANGRLYKSKREGNTGNVPPDVPDPVSGDYENFWWVEISKNDGILQVYRAGLYGAGTVIVFYNYQGEKAEWQGVKFWELNVPEADRPFESEDIEAEIEAETAVWVPAQKVGGEGSAETPETIKAKYESNEDTNAFTDAQKDKLSGVATGATKNTNTDDLDEGEENKYFTESRSIGSKLAGYLKAVSVTAISSATSILQAIGILEKALDSKVDKVPGSGLISDAEKAIFADKYTKGETDNLVSSAVNSIIWKDDVATFADLATTFPAPMEGWTSVVNDENKIYRYDGSAWISIGNTTVPLASASVDGKMSKEDFVKLRDIATEATKNTNTDELDEGEENKYFTDDRAVAAKLAGYVRAETSTPLAETDSILQALGKLDKEFDNKLSVRGENYIGVIGGANAETNGQNLCNAYEAAKLMTPGGNPLSSTNRVTVIVFPGRYDITNTGDLVFANFVDLQGFGNEENVVIDGGYDIKVIQPFETTDLVLQNLSILMQIDMQSEDSTKCYYSNLKTSFLAWGVPDKALNGTFDNIKIPDENFIGIFDTDLVLGGTYRNLPTWGAAGAEGATFERCTIKNNVQHYKNCIIKDCDTPDAPNAALILENTKIYNSTLGHATQSGLESVQIGDGVEMYNCRIAGHIKSYNDAARNTKIYGTYASGTFDENLNNLNDNGHNSWDSEGGGSGGIDHSADILALEQDMSAVMADVTANENAIEVLKKEYVFDIDFEELEDFVFKAPENLIFSPPESEPGTTVTITGHTIGQQINKYQTFTISVNAPGMVTLRGVIQ